MDWNSQQLEAIETTREWLDCVVGNEDLDHRTQVRRIFGYAGTGKTTILKELVKGVKGLVLYGAFTGKAALVMRRNGLIGAQTLHSMMYLFDPPSKTEWDELKNKVEKAQGEEKRKLLTKMDKLKQLNFVLNPESPLITAKLLALDEVSMVDEELGKDAESFRKPILVLGDPGQLPPIKGQGYFTDQNPDIMLTEIHRQAADNPIIKFSMYAREGRPIPFTREGEAKRISTKELTPEMMLEADQILVGKNNTRRVLNQRFRKYYQHQGLYPNIGEKLICLKNDKTMRLFNGLIAYVKNVGDSDGHTIPIKIEREDGGEIWVNALCAHFDEYETPGAYENLALWDKRDCQEFDYGYAITVHKSQGSQWDKVLLWDDKFGGSYDIRCRWLYTGITRAAEELIIVG